MGFSVGYLLPGVSIAFMGSHQIFAFMGSHLKLFAAHCFQIVSNLFRF